MFTHSSIFPVIPASLLPAEANQAQPHPGRLDTGFGGLGLGWECWHPGGSSSGARGQGTAWGGVGVQGLRRATQSFVVGSGIGNSRKVGWLGGQEVRTQLEERFSKGEVAGGEPKRQLQAKS